MCSVALRWNWGTSLWRTTAVLFHYVVRQPRITRDRQNSETKSECFCMSKTEFIRTFYTRKYWISKIHFENSDRHWCVLQSNKKKILIPLSQSQHLYPKVVDTGLSLLISNVLLSDSFDSIIQIKESAS